MNWKKRYSGPVKGCKVKVVSCEDDWEDVPWEKGDILTLTEQKPNESNKWYTEEHGNGDFIITDEFEVLQDV